MKCYTHTDRDAVGICKACYKAVCKECSAQVGNSLACQNTCVEEVGKIDGVMAYSKCAIGLGHEGKRFAPSVVAYGAIGLMFLFVCVVNMILTTGIDFAALGIFLGMGGLAIYQEKFIKKARKPEISGK